MHFCITHNNDIIMQRTIEALSLVLKDVDSHKAHMIQAVCIEAVTNSLKANRKNGGKLITVTWDEFISLYRLKVQDEGGGFDYIFHCSREMPETWEKRGRGIPTMRQLTSRLCYLKTNKGTRFYAIWNKDG